MSSPLTQSMTDSISIPQSILYGFVSELGGNFQHYSTILAPESITNDGNTLSTTSLFHMPTDPTNLPTITDSPGYCLEYLSNGQPVYHEKTGDCTYSSTLPSPTPGAPNSQILVTWINSPFDSMVYYDFFEVPPGNPSDALIIDCRDRTQPSNYKKLDSEPDPQNYGSSPAHRGNRKAPGDITIANFENDCHYHEQTLGSAQFYCSTENSGNIFNCNVPSNDLVESVTPSNPDCGDDMNKMFANLIMVRCTFKVYLDQIKSSLGLHDPLIYHTSIWMEGISRTLPYSRMKRLLVVSTDGYLQMNIAVHGIYLFKRRK
jgi:hypothetical protein